MGLLWRYVREAILAGMGRIECAIISHQRGRGVDTDHRDLNRKFASPQCVPEYHSWDNCVSIACLSIISTSFI